MNTKTIEIAEAFERLTVERQGTWPFDAELIQRSIATLLGDPQKKMKHMHYLSSLASQITDEEYKAQIAVIQLALFEKDLSQLGRDLKGQYQQACETIVVCVESGGVDPSVLDTMINNTLVVLVPPLISGVSGEIIVKYGKKISLKWAKTRAMPTPLKRQSGES